MRLDTETCLARFRSVRSAVLGTVTPQGHPHLVPVVFAWDGTQIVFVIDAKPKSTPQLQRLTNLAAHPGCTLLADHYDDDWNRLWWVRMDGHARIDDDPGAVAHASALISQRYPQTLDTEAPGPAVWITPHRWTGWTAADGAPHW